MRPFVPFEMERWQSTHENRVEYNLSESGVHPLTLRELLDLAGVESVDDTRLVYGQSNGSDELRERIAALYRGATEANVVATNGSAEANFAAVWELVEPGDEVAIVIPTYAQTIGLARMFGATVREIPLREELGWQPAEEDIAAAVTERTKLLVVTNPNNPTGAVLSAAARAALVAAAARVNAWILADEVYAGAELAGPETPSFFGEYPRTVATGSLSKAYGLPGLRLGWVVAPTELAPRLWARTDYTTIAPGTINDRLATLALSPAVRPKLIERTRSILTGSWRVMRDWIDDAGVFTYRAPDAGAIVWLRYELPVNSSVLAERLRAEESVLVVPGDHFAMDRYLRIGYGLLPEHLTVALERVRRTLEAPAKATV
ncbi:MAG: aminotransferase class I/II-fold pyridoxal phosphate-dependent enzyme [Gemmatimonadetes bacterium]|nr:aminotransferase class I/II-fold pyridoxal phosphate-dependent enzyme [Gemmatimonadota bacterium]